MSVKNFRIGNDLTILWAITNRDGSPYNLANKVVRLFVTHPKGRKEVDLSVTTLPDGTTNNVIRWDYQGEQQKVLGLHTLSVEIFADADKKAIKKDYCEAFNLVGSSCEETENKDENIDNSGILYLSSSLDIVQLSKPKIEIGENGNWIIDGVDTGKSAIGGGEGLVNKVYKFSDFGKEFSSVSIVDTFNAYAINKLYDDLTSLRNYVYDLWKLDTDDKLYTEHDLYTKGSLGVGAAGEEGGTSGGGGGIDEDTLRDFLTENRYATEDWVTALGYVTAGEVDTKLAPYATSASVTAQVSAVASGLLNLTERVTPIESWKDRLSKALKYNEQEQCWYIDGKFYVTEALGVGGIAEGGNGGSGGEGTLTGILVNGQKYDSPDEYGILSLPNYPTQEEFDGISERFQTIESYFSSSEDYDDTINKWNEIVSFLNATEGTTLAGILTAYTLKKDFNELSVTVGENSQAIDNHETRIQTWEEWFNSTGKHLLYDKNSNALYSENFYTRGWNAAGGIGEAGSTPEGGGGGRVNGITLNNVNYTEVDAYGNLIISELFATSADAEALVEEIEKLKNAGHITADALIPYIKTTDADAKYSTKKYVDDTFATKVALQNLSLSVDKNAEDIVKHDVRIDSLEDWYNNVGKHILYDSDNKSVYTENFYTTKVLGAGAVGEEGNGGSGAIVDYDSVIQAIGYVPANEVTVDAISNEVSLINNEIDGIEKDIVAINQRFADYYTQDEADNKLTESINGLASDVAESLDTKANKDGSNATGNWGIGITGNAATATKLNDNSEYTIWGQKFFKDGKPSSVNGDMAVTGNASISGTTSVKTLKVGNIELTDDNGRLKVKGDVAVTGTLGVGGIGEEGGSSGGSGSVNGISIDGKTYSPTDGIIDLTQPFANVEVDLSDYYTKQEVDNKTAPLATRDFVTTEIGKIDLSPYAKSKDVQDTYATKKSLSTLQGEVDNIESILGLGEEAEGYINTWGEVKDFLDKISVTDDLADTLLGINTELGNKALGSDLDAAVKRVGTLEGYFDDGIAKKATADASGNVITSTYAKQATIITAGKGLIGGGSLAENRTINVVSANDGIIVNDDNIQLNTINNLSTDSSTKPLSAAQGKALSDRLAVFENWFKADGDDTIKTTFNFFTTKTLAAGGAGEAGGGTGGGATVDYDSVVDALGFTPANVIDLDALATTIGGKQDAINTLTQNAWEAVVAKTGEVDDKLDATTAASTYLKKTDAASTYLGINAKAVSAGSADSATKATNDASGNEITKTYATKNEVNAKYSKPSSGIPKSDLDSGVQTSLGKADTALQFEQYTGTYDKPSGGIPKSDLANAVQVSLGKADTALQEEEDPIFSAHVASDITAEDLGNWDEAFSWGDHANAGYATQSWVNNQGFAAISYLNGYLPKYGGTLTGELTIDAGASKGLKIKASDTQAAQLYVAGGMFNIDSGGMYVNFTSSSLYCGANGYEIYHSGNLTDLATIRSNASLGASAYNTLSSYNLQDISENASLGATAYSSLSGYLPLSGGVINGTSTNPFAIKTSATEVGIPMFVNNSVKMWVGWNSSNGAYLYNSASKVYLGIKDDGTPHYNGNTLIHSGNIGSQSVNYATSAGSVAWANVTDKPSVQSQYKNTGLALSAIDKVAGSSNLWNSNSNSWVFHNSNNALAITVGGTSNDRNAMIQVGHNTSGYGQYTGDLYLNKLGGKVYYGDKEIAVADHSHSYLPLSGGTISGNLDINSQTDTTKRYFRMWYYASNRKNRGMMSVDENNVALDYYSPTDGNYYCLKVGRNGLKYTANYDAENDVIHSGNIGDYALKKVANVSSLDAINAGEFFYSSYRPTSIPKGNYVGGVTLQTFHDAANDYRAQLAFSTEAECFVRRYMNGSWGYWKTIAFTDSDITGKAAGLKHSNGVVGAVINSSGNVTIGGSDLAGTSAKLYVNGNVHVKGCTIYRDDSSEIAYFGPTKNGLGSGYEGAMMYAYDSKPLYFYTGAVRMLINGSGNVTIGGSDLAGTGYKLCVDGSINTKGNLRATLGTASELNVAASNSLNEAQLGVTSSGIAYLFCTGAYDLGISTNSTRRMTITSGGNVGIGTPNPSSKLHVVGDIRSLGDVFFYDSTATNRITFTHASDIARIYNTGNSSSMYIGDYNGNALNIVANNIGIGAKTPEYKLDVSGDIRATGNITASAFYMSSDETLKDFGKDIEIDFERLKNLPKKYFTWKSGGDKQIGTSAQEVQKLFPEIVGKKADGTLTVDYSKLTMPALAAIDKLYTENQELKERVANLEKMICHG